MAGLPVRLPMPDDGREEDEDEHVDDESERLAYDNFGGGHRGGRPLAPFWFSTTPRPSIDFLRVGSCCSLPSTGVSVDACPAWSDHSSKLLSIERDDGANCASRC